MPRIARLLPVGAADQATHRGARRSSQRWPLLADVELLEPEPASGMVLNASAGGMRVAVDRPVEVGSRCVARVRTERRETEEHARVVWQRELPDGWLLGLEFTDDE